MTARWTAPDIAGLRGDNTRPLQKIFASLTEYLQGLVENTRVLQTYVRNAETTTLEIGEVVYLHERQGDRATVKRASNTSDATSAKTLGVVAERIAPNADGLVTTQGYVYHMNLSAFTAGQTVYLSNVAGGITATKPVAPNHLVYVGVVVRANAGNGILYARAQNGYELDEIHDVLISSPTQGQVLSYNASTSLWQNSTFSDGGGLTNLNASNLASGTVPSARVSGSYSGITGVGTLTGLTIGGAGADRSITINAPSGYYAIQYFAINGTNEWHYEVTPSGSSWSLVESGVAARLTMTNTTLTVAGGVTASSRIHAQTDLRVGNTNSAVLSSDAYALIVTPQAYTGLPVRLGEFYSGAGVGSTNSEFTVYASPSTGGTVYLKRAGGITMGSFQTNGLYLNEGWLRTYNDRGWYSETYGGGWHMTDTTYIRAYNGKAIRAENLISAHKMECFGAGGNASDHGSQLLRVLSWGQVAGMSFWPINHGIAPVFRCWSGHGEGIDCGNNPATGYAWLGASSFITRCSIEWKDNTRTKEDDEIISDVLSALSIPVVKFDDKYGEPVLVEGEWQSMRTADLPEEERIKPLQTNHLDREGFIAEEVAAIFPKASTYDAEGNPNGTDMAVITVQMLDALKLLVLQGEDLSRRLMVLEEASGTAS
jgi:hypothetical protein